MASDLVYGPIPKRWRTTWSSRFVWCCRPRRDFRRGGAAIWRFRFLRGRNNMSARVLMGVFIVAASASTMAAEESYVIEPVHSQPQWETRHIGMSPQRGSFGKTTGKVTLDREAKKGSIDVTIDAASIRTFDGRLDAIVKGDRFFNVEKFPTLAFKSDKFTFDGDRVVQVDGDFTMIGVTK